MEYFQLFFDYFIVLCMGFCIWIARFFEQVSSLPGPLPMSNKSPLIGTSNKYSTSPRPNQPSCKWPILVSFQGSGRSPAYSCLGAYFLWAPWAVSDGGLSHIKLIPLAGLVHAKSRL